MYRHNLKNELNKLKYFENENFMFIQIIHSMNIFVDTINFVIIYILKTNKNNKCHSFFKF